METPTLADFAVERRADVQAVTTAKPLRLVRMSALHSGIQRFRQLILGRFGATSLFVFGADAPRLLLAIRRGPFRGALTRRQILWPDIVHVTLPSWLLQTNAGR